MTIETLGAFPTLFGGVYASRRVLVTGDTGFKGSWLASWLHLLGAEVHGLANGTPTLPAMYDLLDLPRRVTHHAADVADSTAVARVVSEVQPDFVFHLAAQAIVKTSYEDPVETFRTNVLGTAAVLNALRSTASPCVAVMITSDKCYENVEWTWGYRENDRLGGKDPYSASKAAAENVIRAFYCSYFSQPESRVQLASVRAGNVIGGGDWAVGRIVPDCIRAWMTGLPVEIRSPNATRPWQHVLEPLSGYLRTGQMLAQRISHCHGESFNFGPPAENNFTVLALLQEIAKFWPFANSAESPFFVKPAGFHEAGLLKLNCDLAHQILDWRPVLTFAETAQFTSQWYDRAMFTKSADPWSVTLQQLHDYVRLAAERRAAWV